MTTALEYISDEVPGIRRRRAGRGFVYLGPRGQRVTNANELQRIKALAIPPAWTDVWICTRANGHLQATGRDARGRKQYRYHPDWRALRDRVKFDHLLEFGHALPRVRGQVERDLRGTELSRERVVALVVRLLETSMVRVGNEEYAQQNGSFGLTTLRRRHARPAGRSMELVFPGKSGREHRTVITERRVVRAVRQCQEIPGQLLFQYLDDDGVRRPVKSEDVNEYLRSNAGLDVTAKDYRTWVGTLLAATALAGLPAPTSERRAATAIGRVIETVSDELGNTPAVCRASYVHPEIIETFRAGRLAEQWAAASTASPRRLIAEERRLLGVLRALRRRGRAVDAVLEAA